MSDVDRTATLSGVGPAFWPAMLSVTSESSPRAAFLLACCPRFSPSFSFVARFIRYRTRGGYRPVALAHGRNVAEGA
jgi:hypothetical protein